MSRSVPLVSVIVPTRNSERTLAACLKSIRAQALQAIELIVVDNSSTDRTLSIAETYADVVESFGPERSAQRNRGAQIARGDYLLFIDSDMRLSPTVIGDCLDTMGATGARAAIIPEVSIGEGFLTKCRALERSCYIGDDAIEAARFFPRTEFQRSGGYDEGLVAMEDWDLSTRVAAGARLPRITSIIEHDEGRLRLSTVLAKKRYYAESSLHYIRKGGRPTLSQANLIFRPAFARSWRRLLRHPLLTTGFLSLKSLETGAVIWGVLAARAHRRDARGAIQP